MERDLPECQRVGFVLLPKKVRGELDVPESSAATMSMVIAMCYWQPSPLPELPTPRAPHPSLQVHRVVTPQLRALAAAGQPPLELVALTLDDADSWPPGLAAIVHKAPGARLVRALAPAVGTAPPHGGRCCLLTCAGRACTQVPFFVSPRTTQHVVTPCFDHRCRAVARRLPTRQPAHPSH